MPKAILKVSPGDVENFYVDILNQTSPIVPQRHGPFESAEVAEAYIDQRVAEGSAERSPDDNEEANIKQSGDGWMALRAERRAEKKRQIEADQLEHGAGQATVGETNHLAV